MKLGLALGAAVIAITAAAYATEGGRHFVFHRGGEQVSADTNNDGWLSREEAGAEADRLFADLDRDNNGRLEDADGEALEREVEAEVERAMAEVEREMANYEHEMENFNLELEGLDEEVEARVMLLNEGNCETTTENRDGERRVTTICREDADDDDNADGDRRVDRRVHVIRRGPGDVLIHPIPPVPPVPPVPAVPPIPHHPMFWGGDDSESDLNNDGWISREEFRAQQLRFFDARDANRDGRVRYERLPEPPEPPQPPEPPHRRHD